MPHQSGHSPKRQRTNPSPEQINFAVSSHNNTANPQQCADASPNQNNAESPRPARTLPEPLLPAKNDDFILDQKGDLVLVIGPGQQKIKLCSDRLKQISPVLEDKIRRVQEINVKVNILKRQYEIHLVEDNADAFKILCGFIYGQRLTEYDCITASQLLDLALLAVKYQCQDRLYYGTVYYFARVSSSQLSSEETWKLYAAAYLLNRPGDFQKYANELISNHKGSFLPFAELIPDVLLAAKLCWALEEQRGRKEKAMGVNLVICLECFNKAKISFEPNIFCPSCQRGFTIRPFASLGASLARMTDAPPERNKTSLFGHVAPSTFIKDGARSSIFSTTRPASKEGPRTISPGAITGANNTEPSNAVNSQAKTAGNFANLKDVEPDPRGEPWKESGPAKK